MENVKENDPKEDQITNKDDAVTNKDGDNNLEKGEEWTDKNKSIQTEASTIDPCNDNPELYEPADESSNKGQGPSGENL